jgi:hypothetical protein
MAPRIVREIFEILSALKATGVSILVIEQNARAPRRAQLSIRRDRRNYDRSMAGLGTSKAQRYFAFDFDRLSLVRRYRDHSGRSRSRQRATPRYCTGPAGTARQYWMEEESTRTKYVKEPGLLQPVEKKGKCASSIAPIIWRPKNRLDRLGL